MDDIVSLDERAAVCKRSLASDPTDATWLMDRMQMGWARRFAVIKDVSPELATLMLEFNVRNRNIYPNTIRLYAEAMEAGEWMLTSDSIAFDKDGGLQNGQHRLQAIIETGCTVPITIWFGTEPAEFRVLDQGRVRTGTGYIDSAGLDKTHQRAALVRSLKCLETGNEKRMAPAATGDKALEMSLDPRTEAALLAGFKSHKVVKHSAGCLAYYWISVKSADPAKLPEFWEMFSSGEWGSDTTVAAIRVVRDGLMKREIAPGPSMPSTIKQVAAIIFAWNAWCNGKLRCKLVWPHIYSLPDVDAPKRTRR